MSDSGSVQRSVASRRVFISHAYADRELAKRLGAALHRAGLAVDDALDVAPGDNIVAAISRTIAQADIVIVVVSPRATTSHFVETEAAIAVGRALSGGGGRVVPLILEGAELPYVLQDLHSLQVDDPEDVESVAAQIAHLPAETPFEHKDLALSAVYLHRSLERERRLYALKRDYQARERIHRLERVAVGLAAGVAITSLFVAGLGDSNLLALILAPAAALLGAAVAFYFGQQSSLGGDEPDDREKP